LRSPQKSAALLKRQVVHTPNDRVRSGWRRFLFGADGKDKQQRRENRKKQGEKTLKPDREEVCYNRPGKTMVESAHISTFSIA
jgi:hypothetical protein